MVDARNELLAQFPEREDPAVRFEQRHHGRIMRRDKRIGELIDQGPKGRCRGPERVDQRLLGLGQRREERPVGQQWNDLGLVAVQAFISEVEERRVRFDRTANGYPGLRARIGRLAGVEVIACLEAAVAQNAEKGSMHLVRATLRDDVDRAARRPALFGGERVSVDLELLDGILADRGSNASGVVQVVQPVDHERVAASVAPTDAESRRGGGGDAAIDRVGDVVGIHHAWGQQRQVQIVATVDREILDTHRVDVIGLLHARGFDGRARRCRHNDPCFSCSDRELGRKR